MYKRAFGIKFPETPAKIADGIRERHDIVHRNGTTVDGAEGSWGLVDILALKTAVLDFAGSIDAQARSFQAVHWRVRPQFQMRRMSLLSSELFPAKDNSGRARISNEKRASLPNPLCRKVAKPDT